MVENITFYQIITGVLWVCGVVTAIGGAVVMIAKAVKTLKAPNDSQDSRLTKLEGRMSKVEGYLANDDARLKALEDVNRMSMRAFRALLGHGLDGNNQGPMQKSLNEIDEYLVNK